MTATARSWLLAAGLAAALGIVVALSLARRETAAGITPDVAAVPDRRADAPMPDRAAPELDAREAPADRRFAGSLAAPAAPPLRTTLRFRAAEGEPPRTLWVAVLAGGECIAAAKLELGGAAPALIVEHAAALDAEVLALAAEVLPHRGVHALDGGTVEIALARGRAVAGRMLVGGRVPDERFDLALRSESALPPGLEIPDAARDALRGGLDARAERTVVTGPDGAFAFHGLADSWRGELALPAALRFGLAPDGATLVDLDRLRLEAPNAGLVLDVLSRPRLLGRVVEHPGGPPVARARVTLRADLDGEPLEPGWGDAVTELDGRFAIPLARGRLTDATLELGAPSPGAWTTTRLADAVLDADVDLGDVALADQAGRPILLRVTDRDGAPVRDAHALDGRTRAPLGAPTGPDGTSAVRVPAAAEAVHVVAFGFDVAEVRVPAPEAEELTVVLGRAAAIEVVCVGPDGEPARPYALIVDSPRRLFRDGLPRREFRAIGGPLYSMSEREAPSRQALIYDAEGPLVLCGIETGVPFTLIATDLVQRPLAEVAVPAIVPEEVRRVTLRCEATSTLVCRVASELGQGIAGVELNVVGGPPGSTILWGVPRTTEADGLAIFAPLRRGPIQLHVDEEGFVPVRLSDVVLTEERERVEVRLERGRDLVVVLETEAGEPIDAQVSVRLAGRREADSIGLGRYRLTDLPGHPVVLEIERGDTTIEREVDPGAGGGEARLVLPW